ncbi:MAG: hypothetical protein OHK0022_05670 [Roseiflexaceae bacterium]
MPTQSSGPQRHQIPTQRAEDIQAIEAMRASGVLVVDDRRRRPNYFDGRFLTARDLTREQTYFLTRQSDLGRATGPGVVRGLMVDLETQPTGEPLLRIRAGHGLTASGELVLLAEDLRLRLSDIPEVERLNARFGLSRVPGPPARNRSGAFLLALRPVEFTANPIASYPTSITGSRTVEDSDIIEAVAVTLMPYGESGSGLSPLQRQAQLARDMFVQNRQAGGPIDALPLALIYLERNHIEWVDPFLVRREVGAERSDVLGLGFAPRAVREAHLIQYRQQLQAVQAQRAAGSQGQRFAATEHFQALPPAGQLPKAAINPADFTQVFFPPEIAVDLAIIPEDELAALIEESFLLPPIDLAAGTEALESTSVVMLLPVARSTFRALKSTLDEGALPDAPLVRALRPAVPSLVARSRPLEVLTGLRQARRELLGLPNPEALASPIDIGWQQVLADPQIQLLWYTRQRNMAYAAAVTGEPVPLLTDPLPDDNPPGEDQPGDEDPLAFLDPLNLRAPYLALAGYLTGQQMTALRQTLQATPLTQVVVGDVAPFGYILLAQINRSCKASGDAISTAVLAALLGEYVAWGANDRTPLLDVFKVNPAVAGLLAASSRAFELLTRVSGMSKVEYTGASSLLSKVSTSSELAQAISTIMGDILPPLPDM